MQKTKQKEDLEKQYEDLKEKVREFEDKRYLFLFRILTKAYKIGKELYGDRMFGYGDLARDFDMSYTTVQRIMRLRYANERTKKMVDEGKISLRKVAYILNRNSKDRQDEVVDLVLERKLKLNEIMKLTKYSSKKDFAKQKQMLSIKRGYAQRESAYRAWKNYISKTYRIILINPKDLPKERIEELKKDIEKVKKILTKYKSCLENGRHFAE